MRRRRTRGQTAVEYMLAISVIVIAVTFAAWPLYTYLQSGVKEFGDEFETYYAKQDDRTPSH